LKQTGAQNPPFNELVPPAAGGKSLENCAFFVIEKQPSSIAIEWSAPVPGQEFHTLKSSAFPPRT